MENFGGNHGRYLARQRRTGRRVIAALCIGAAVAGILFLLFSSALQSGSRSLPLRDMLNSLIPGLFEVIVFLAFLIAFAGIAVYFALRPPPEEEEELLDSSWDRWQSLDQAHDACLREEHKPAAPQPRQDSLAAPQPAPLKQPEPVQELLSEKLLNNLLFALLNNSTAGAQYKPAEVLSALGIYCKCDFTALYQKDENTGLFRKLGHWDADPDLARHSARIESLDLPAYRWMSKTLGEGRAFVFRASMLDIMLDSVQGAADDVRDWMRMQAQESAEHKLSRHEGWEYFICLPCRDGDAISGLFLIGYHKPELPVAASALDRLTSISSLFGRQIRASAAAALPAESGSGLQLALDGLDDAIFTTDLQGALTAVNRSALDLCGGAREAVLGQPWQSVFRLINTDTRFPFQNPVSRITREACTRVSLKGTSIVTPESNEVLLDGLAAPVADLTGKAAGVVFLLRDVTGSSREQAENMQEQKMEAISSLSAGFAHDFNNILTAILGNISLALDDAPKGSEQEAMLKAAEESTLKGKEITDNLLIMARANPIQEKASEASRLLEKTVLGLLAGSGVKPIFQFEADLPPIQMSAEIFERIISNLVTNALQAMKLGGLLYVSANVCSLAEGAGLPLKPGKYLCLHIKDNGEGIPLENQGRVFVPYFTTRPQASGMGLTIAYSLLKKHNGYIRLHSQSGQGTDCELYIPVAVTAVRETPEAKPRPANAAPLVLVLDEDDALGSLLVKTMVKMGLRVQKTTDPDELSSLFFRAENNGMPVRLVLADLNLPSSVNIAELMRIFKKSDPEVKLIAYSNQIRSEDAEEYKKQNFDDVLPKPFNIGELRTVITRNINL